MRVITQHAHKAFANKKRFSSRNTKVVIEDGEAKMYLHNNLIAKTENGELFISDGGYGTSNTTRDRLNGFSQVWLRFSKGQWISNNITPWDGKWINVKDL
jgi:hypothetical protein